MEGDMKRHRTSITVATLALGMLIGFAPAFGELTGDNTVAEGAKVTIMFTISVPESHLVIPDNVSEYVPGQNQLIPALEQALTGMKPGEQKRVDLQADEAFGQYDEQKKITIRREQLPQDAQVGSAYQTADGVPFTVAELSGGSAVVDFNHPLAGKHLVFDVKIVKVEQAT